MSKNDVLSILEAAYRLETTSEQWLSELSEAVVGSNPHVDGLLACIVDGSDPERGIEVLHHQGLDVSNGFVEGMLRVNANSTPEEVRFFYHRGVLVGTVSEQLGTIGAVIDDNETIQSFGPSDFCDMWAVGAVDPLGRGVAFNAPLAEVYRLSHREKDVWTMVGVHVAHAHRLRRALAAGDGVQAGEAVLEPDGRVAHAEGEAASESARTALRSAAKKIDRARGKLRREDEDQALSLWTGLVEGRWSLVDQFDTDGRRYMIAYPNPVPMRNPRKLSERELQVIAYASQGDSNKWIAYELGLSQASVGTYLRRAMRKIGIDSREKLIWIRQQIASAEHASGE